MKRLIFAGLTAALLCGCDQHKEAPHQDPLVLIRQELDAALTKTSGWQRNRKFMMLLLSGEMATGQCDRVPEHLEDFLNNGAATSAGRANLGDLPFRMDVEALATTLVTGQNKSPCFEAVASRLLDRLPDFQPQQATMAAGLAGAITAAYRERGEEAKAQDAEARLTALSWQSMGGKPVKPGAYPFFKKQLNAYISHGDKDKATALLKRLWSEDIPGFEPFSPTDRYSLAGDALRLGDYPLFLEMTAGHEHESWVEFEANSATPGALLKAPTDVAWRIVSYAEPGMRGRGTLPVFFETKVRENQGRIKPMADRLFQWIFDPLDRARAEALFGAALGRISDRDAPTWCAKTKDVIDAHKSDTDRSSRFKLDRTVRAYGACVYSALGVKKLEAEQARTFNVRQRGALAGGAASYAMREKDWGAFVALMRLNDSMTEQSTVWYDLLNTVRSDPSYHATPDVAALLESYLRREHDKQHVATLKPLLLAVNPAAASQMDEKAIAALPFEPRFKTMLALANAHVKAGDRKAGRALMKTVSGMVAKTENPTWIGDAALSMAASGQWDLAVETSAAIKNPVIRANLAAIFYIFYAGKGIPALPVHHS